MTGASGLRDQAVITICHGGNGTVYQSLAHGVPVLSISTHVDQQWVGEAVARRGAGWRVPDRDVTGDQIAAIVRQVLAEPIWRRNAEAVAKRLARENGAATAAKEISAFAARHSPSG